MHKDMNFWIQLRVKGLFFQTYESGKEAYEPANPMITHITPQFANFGLEVCMFTLDYIKVYVFNIILNVDNADPC